MLKRKWALALLAVIALCSVVLSYNVIADAWRKDNGWIAAGFVVLLLGIWWAIEWTLSEEFRGARRWTMVLEPARLARIGLVAIGGPLTISQALPLFEPGPMTRDDVREVLDEHRATAAERERDTLLRAIPGLWGEPGCLVAYRFATVGQSGLRITWERRPPGEPEWTATGTIIAARAGRLETRGVTPADQRGRAATFLYDNAGAAERLLWKDESRDVAAELWRCA